MQIEKQQLSTKSIKRLGFSLAETAAESQKQPLQEIAKQIPLLKKIEAKIVQIEGQSYERTLAKNYMFSYVLNKIQRNDCFQHSYLLFYIPALLVISRHLSFFVNQKNSASFKLLIFFIKRIDQIFKQNPKQMNQAQLMKYVTVALKYRDAETVKKSLKQFMQRNYLKMMGFMPVYGLYFKLLADVDQLLHKNAHINDAIQLIKKTQVQFKKYHNQQI